jgi:hypothetical protein
MTNNENNWRDIEKEDPEAFKIMMGFFRKLKAVTEDIQVEMSLELLKDEAYRKVFNEADGKPEEYSMALIDKYVRLFVSIIPIALANGVNPIMTILSSHSAITGDPLIDNIISKLNEETLEESAELEENNK